MFRLGTGAGYNVRTGSLLRSSGVVRISDISLYPLAARPIELLEANISVAVVVLNILIIYSMLISLLANIVNYYC